MRLLLNRLACCCAFVLCCGCAPGGSCAVHGPGAVESGVPITLARERAGSISNLSYRVSFTIRQAEAVRGSVEISFDLENAGAPLVIDFAGKEVLSVKGKDGELPYGFENEHIFIGPGHVDEGPNTFEIAFISDERPLHREEDYLYSLFVPALARFVFPCFDQPDLKAGFTLTLEIPAGWKAVSNTPAAAEEVEGDRRRVIFSGTEPLSTYLFSFAAGEFEVERAQRQGRIMELYHMERDTARVERNLEAIFDLHAGALGWMEEYTGIGYPFGKFGFVLIPSFPYSGMEHPGAICYRAERLFLDESATELDRLRRASVISHETAHMWFGDLVTMAWFDDVWLKEAFAQFMADRIIRPAFPGINHQLLFSASHYGPLYDIERTAGTHPIRQELENLDEAGSLYGNIIYHKPPVMLNQLEALMGEERLREGLRIYLERFGFGNAGWEDIVSVLDRLTEKDLGGWSLAWVMERGRPEISYRRSNERDGAFNGLRVRQNDPLGRGLVWPQRFNMVVKGPEGERVLPLDMDGPEMDVSVEVPIGPGDFILPDGGSEGFGFFRLDGQSRLSLEQDPPRFEDPLGRAVYARALRDNLLEGVIDDPHLYMRCLLSELERETVEIILQTLLDYIVETFWCFITDNSRRDFAPVIEEVLLARIHSSLAPSAKSACFKAYRSIVSTDGGIELLNRIWEEEMRVEGIKFSERDFCAMALGLATRRIAGWQDVLDRQAERIRDEEVKRRFLFVRRAASADERTRDDFFDGLAYAENRRHEPWVLEALYYLHHPLRGRYPDRYILPSLELLEEIRATGDIFFPRDWLGTTLGYHSSDEAVSAVDEFLGKRPGYPERLKLMILQAADRLYRANRILGGDASLGK